MKKSVTLLLVMFCIAIACNTQRNVTPSNTHTTGIVGDTIRIANDELEYEVIIIDPGFSSWMLTNARPRGHYTQQYMEMRNRTWVNEWNNRARVPSKANTYLMPIDYQSTIDYGYEVNYMLFNYLTYFQIKNNIRLGGFVPRI